MLPLFATGVIDIGVKFDAGIVDAGIVDTSGKFATGSTMLAKLVEKYDAGVIDTGGKFVAGVVILAAILPLVSLTNLPPVVDTGGAPRIANISMKFRKNSEWS